MLNLFSSKGMEESRNVSDKQMISISLTVNSMEQEFWNNLSQKR